MLELQLGSAKIAAKAWGPENGRPVLALHGWLDNAASFDRVAPLLPGLRIVAPDFPGHGHSDPLPTGTNYHFIDGVVFAAQFADALGWKEYAVLGHSMGGAIGTLLAGARPNTISKLFLIDALGPLAETAEGNVDRLRSYIEKKLRPQAARRSRTFASLDAMVEARQKVAPLSDEGGRCIIERGSRKVEGGYTWSSDPRLTAPSALRMTETQVLAFLKRIVCPVQIVWAKDGETGRMPYVASHMRLRVEALTHVTEMQLEGGHHVHLDTPAAVAVKINAFLA